VASGAAPTLFCGDFEVVAAEESEERDDDGGKWATSACVLSTELEDAGDVTGADTVELIGGTSVGTSMARVDLKTCPVGVVDDAAYIVGAADVTVVVCAVDVTVAVCVVDVTVVVGVVDVTDAVCVVDVTVVVGVVDVTDAVCAADVTVAVCVVDVPVVVGVVDVTDAAVVGAVFDGRTDVDAETTVSGLLDVEVASSDNDDMVDVAVVDGMTEVDVVFTTAALVVLGRDEDGFIKKDDDMRLSAAVRGISTSAFPNCATTHWRMNSNRIRRLRGQ
jgi:hypothetical protein